MFFKSRFFHYLLLFLAFFLVCVFYLLINAPTPALTEQTFIISKGESVSSISQRLKEQGFLLSEPLFKVYLKMTGTASRLKAGYYLLPARVNLRELIGLLTNNQASQNHIFLITEGETLLEIDNDLHQKNILASEQTLLTLKIKDFVSAYPQLFEGAPLENSLEGYLFPDSYHLPPGLSAQEISNLLLTNFQEKLQQNNLLAENNGHSFYENLILASILEKEVQTFNDKRQVADLLWRRLENNLPLQVDASICYAQKKSFENCDLTPEAFKFDSPYNTYLYYGLPPTPISNPGLESLKAAYSPLANDYWYYLTNRKTKETIFSKTYEEHQQARQKYL